MRVLRFSYTKKKLVSYKLAYNGTYSTFALINSKDVEAIQKKRKKKSKGPPVKLQACYKTKLPIKAAKYKDLVHLSQFLEKPKAKLFYEALNSTDLPEEECDEFVDDPPVDAE